ncbi:MAG: 3-hydroxybutyryl-CoA dehydrogenase, partial [Gemmatimonadetes bacterium]
MQHVAVIGAGTMGNGIVHVFAQTGYDVTCVDVNPVALEKALATISKNMDRQIKKEKITEDDKKAALARITTTTDMNAIKDVDLVIEAATENIDLKQKIFAQMSELTRDDVILATNTSSISITMLAAHTTRPDKVIGMHFMNPVPVMKLVEIIRGYATSDETYQTIDELAKKLGKTPAMSNDYPGFIANRILMPMINEAIFALYEGVGSKEDIDTVMKLGMNHPMGPLTLADFIGLDVCLAIMEVLYEGFKDPKYRP